MLATLVRELPTSPAEWAAEVKWDGARAIAYVAGGEVSLRNRNGGDVTGTFPEAAEAISEGHLRRADPQRPPPPPGLARPSPRLIASGQRG